eukprot:266914_1
MASIPSSWQCNRCYYVNQTRHTLCGVCDSPKSLQTPSPNTNNTLIGHKRKHTNDINNSNPKPSKRQKIPQLIDDDDDDYDYDIKNTNNKNTNNNNEIIIDTTTNHGFNFNVPKMSPKPKNDFHDELNIKYENNRYNEQNTNTNKLLKEYRNELEYYKNIENKLKKNDYNNNKLIMDKLQEIQKYKCIILN